MLVLHHHEVPSRIVRARLLRLDLLVPPLPTDLGLIASSRLGAAIAAEVDIVVYLLHDLVRKALTSCPGSAVHITVQLHAIAGSQKLDSRPLPRLASGKDTAPRLGASLDRAVNHAYGLVCLLPLLGSEAMPLPVCMRGTRRKERREDRQYLEMSSAKIVRIVGNGAGQDEARPCLIGETEAWRGAGLE
jgi:hypothetical protein